MEQLVLTHFSLLPEHLQVEVLHYIQFLAKEIAPTNRSVKSTQHKRKILTFKDFNFQERGSSYSRSEIYGDYGR